MRVQSIVNFVPDMSQEGFKILSPATGQVDVLDSALSVTNAFHTVGEGVLVRLEGQTICSPINGTVIEYVPSFGKVIIQAKNKMRFVLQLAVEHIDLHSLGIKSLITNKQIVEVGQPLYQLDLYKIKLQLKPVILYFLLLDYQRFKSIEASKRQVEAGHDTIFTLIPKQEKAE